MIEYIGMPYDIKNQHGVNCWGLVAKVYNDKFSDDLPDFPSPSKSLADISATFTAAFANGNHGFTMVDKPQNYDVVVFKRKMAKCFYFHCGIWLDGKILHSASRSGGVVYEAFDSVARQFKVVEFWRK